MQTTDGSSLLPTVLCAVIGAVMASALGVDSDFVFGAISGALIGQVWSLRQQLRELRNVFDRNTITASTPATQATAAANEQRIATPTVANASSPVAAHASSAPTAPSHRAYKAPPPSALELRLRAAWAWLKTRNPIALAAVGISFLGGVFLVKYVAEHAHFPIEYRFIGLGLTTIGGVLLGWRLHARNAMFAQILQGGGIAGLYLTLFAATRLYALLPYSLTFALMVGVAIAAALLAVAQDALALAIIGTAGGFLTPLLLANDSGNHIALFTYYALLNLGIFAVAWFRTWRVLNVLGFIFTFSITALWRADAYQATQWLSTELFLALFFLMYVAVSVLNALRQPVNLKGYVSGSLVFGLPVVAFSLHTSLIRHVPYALAYSALGIAIFYCVLAWSLYRTRRTSLRLLVEAFAALSVIFASLAIPLAFDRHVTSAMWSIEGAGLMWLGLRQQRKLPRVFGALLQAAAGVAYLLMWLLPAGATQETWAVINSAYIGSALLCVAATFSAWQLQLHRQVLARYETAWPSVSLAAGCVWFVLGGLVEIDAHFTSSRAGASLTYLALGGGGLWLMAQRWPWNAARIFALLAPALGAIIGVMQLLGGTHDLHPFNHWGALGWPVLFAVQYWLLRRGEGENDIAPALFNTLHTCAYIAAAIIVGWELAWRLSHSIGGVWGWLPMGLVPALWLWCAAHPVPNRRWPWVRYPLEYRTHAGVTLAAWLALWVLVVNFSSDGDPLAITYLPLLNPLDITCMLIGLALTRWWLTLSASERATCWPQEINPLLVIAPLGFIWANAALIRALHYLCGVPLEASTLFHSTLVQASLSVFWMLLALAAMLTASQRLLRTLWLTGAGLMSIVIIKLLLIDLSNTGTLARIISFLTVGGLLFVVSYWSPLPPASEPRNTAE